eukprot:364074-Chlamydomonas_euryale.AAC.3
MRRRFRRSMLNPSCVCRATAGAHPGCKATGSGCKTFTFLSLAVRAVGICHHKRLRSKTHTKRPCRPNLVVKMADPLDHAEAGQL